MPPEPSDFDLKVRHEGLCHLREQGHDPETPPPNRQIWEIMRRGTDGHVRTAEYWQLARDSLRAGYTNRCVYSCFTLEDQRNAAGNLQSTHSIDHFLPKSLSPARLAYEWSNLRWSWRVIDNEGKGNNLIPLDPTTINRCLMELHEDSNGDWMVVPLKEGLSTMERNQVDCTIRLLGLNLRKVVIRRNQYVDDFKKNGGLYGDDFMNERQPFVYQELKRYGQV